MDPERQRSLGEPGESICAAEGEDTPHILIVATRIVNNY